MFAKIGNLATWRIVAGAACMVAVAIFAGPTAAAESGGKKMPVYMGVMQNEAGETQVKFVFSDLGAPGRFVPRQAISIRPKDGHCNMAQDDDLNLPPEYTGSPIYDSARDAEKIPLATLPNYLARTVGAEMQRKGFVAKDEEALPAVACTRKVWKAIVGAE